LADAVVDIVETGTTLKENGLQAVDDISRVSARLIVNIASMKINRTQIMEFVDKLDSVL
jgi:ATP phosphoribosyltransferase